VFRILLSSLVVLVALGAACVGGSSKSGSLTEEVTADETGNQPVRMQVISHNFTDVVVYLLVGSHRQRLGTAVGKRTTVFTVPWRQVAGAARIQLLGDPIGSQSRVTSDILQLTPGNDVVWTLESNLDSTSTAVY
jgi:hypothetical protein